MFSVWMRFEERDNYHSGSDNRNKWHFEDELGVSTHVITQRKSGINKKVK